MWIVMTSSAKMPNSCWGRYINIALVQLDQYYTENDLLPKMISHRARGVLRVIHLGHHFEGKSDRCAAAKVLKQAEQRALQMNTQEGKL